MNSREYQDHLRTVSAGDCDCWACRLWFRDEFVCHGCAAEVAAKFDGGKQGEPVEIWVCPVCWETIERVLEELR